MPCLSKARWRAAAFRAGSKALRRHGRVYDCEETGGVAPISPGVMSMTAGRANSLRGRSS